MKSESYLRNEFIIVIVMLTDVNSPYALVNTLQGINLHVGSRKCVDSTSQQELIQ